MFRPSLRQRARKGSLKENPRLNRVNQWFAQNLWVFVSTATTVSIFLWLTRGTKAPPPVQWDSDLIHGDPTVCQRTKFMPFHMGCPKSCVGVRPGIVNDSEPMYRMTMEWAFGEPHRYPEGGPMPEESAYEMGINYQCPEAFVRSFVQASRQVQEQAHATIPNVIAKHQDYMHLTLANYCCLMQNETDWVREIMYRWVLDHRPFDFTVGFDSVECWHERFNAVTNIIVNDEATQRTLMRMNHNLNNHLKQHNIPITVPRESQMPFHVTLMGLSIGEDYSTDPEHSIEPQLPIINEIVSGLSSEMRLKWFGQGGSQMRIAHEPRFSYKGHPQFDV